MKIKRLAMVVLAATLVLGGCSTSQTTPEVKEPVVETPAPDKDEAATFPVTFTDSSGIEVTVADEPQRIVSLAPSTTEILYFLGVEDKIVGRTKYCSYPESMGEVTEVGGTSDPNVETVIGLNPDLVVASTHTSEEVMAKLREVGIPVAFLNEQENVEGTYAAIENLGLLIGEQEKAEEVVEGMKASIAATTEKVQKATEGKELPKVYYMMWYGDSDSTAGGNTFIGELIRLAGGKNIAEEVVGWSITKEVIAEQDPDIIIVPKGSGIAEAIVDEPFYKDLRAVKEGKVFEVDEDMISRQAPRIADVFEDLAMIIHPEIQ